MTQNINLIEDLNIQPISAFNSKLIVQIAMFWVVLLILTYVLALGINMNRQKKLVVLEAKQKSLTAKLAAYYQEVIPVKLEDQKKILPLSSINLQGFYLYLKDLARLTPNGVWLKEIDLSEKENFITMKGSAINAAGVSAFITALNQSIKLKDKKFNTFVVQRNLETNDVDFIISSIVVNPNEKGKEKK